MRIALLTAHYQPARTACGVGDYTRCLRHAFERRGHDCLILTSASTRTGEKDVHRLSGRWDLRDLSRAVDILTAARVDLVIMQYTPEQYGYGLLFKLLPIRLRMARPSAVFITTFHTLVGGRSIAKASALLLAASSHVAVSIHAELSDLYRRRLPWWSHKLREIPIGANIPDPTIDTETAKAGLRARLGLAAKTPLLGTFGFACPGKGLETLFHALHALNQSREVHLLCIGEDRAEDVAYRCTLKELEGRLGLGPRVHWLGGLSGEEVANLLLGVNAYVVPYDDGASLRRGTLMAGFQVGVPIVTTIPRYPDDALRSGETVLAVPTQSHEALAHSITALLADPILQQKLRDGMTSVSARFGWDAIAAQHEACTVPRTTSLGVAA